MLQSLGLQRVRHNLATEQQQSTETSSLLLQILSIFEILEKFRIRKNQKETVIETSDKWWATWSMWQSFIPKEGETHWLSTFWVPDLGAEILPSSYLIDFIGFILLMWKLRPQKTKWFAKCHSLIESESRLKSARAQSPNYFPWHYMASSQSDLSLASPFCLPEAIF